MKPVFCLFMLSACLFSCRGKKLSHPVSVQFITLNKSGVYPEGHFPLSNPNELPEYPYYVNASDTQEVADSFNSDLIRHIEKNNIYLQNDTADYVLYITSMYLSESRKSESYIDSCSADYPTRYVYYATLNFKATAVLYKNGIKLGSWTREANSRETVKDKTDSCNQPKIRRLFRGPYSLVNQVSKELRVKISRKMYELEN